MSRCHQRVGRVHLGRVPAPGPDTARRLRATHGHRLSRAASRTSALRATTGTRSPSRTSMARVVTLSRRALKRPPRFPHSGPVGIRPAHGALEHLADADDPPTGPRRHALGSWDGTAAVGRGALGTRAAGPATRAGSVVGPPRVRRCQNRA